MLILQINKIVKCYSSYSKTLCVGFNRFIHDQNKDSNSIGTCKFKDLVSDKLLFVDKSLFIKAFINNKAQALLITCPRRWGKSMNMNMLKTFFEIQHDVNANPEKALSEETIAKTIQKTENYKLFHGDDCSNESGLKQKQEPLKITEHKHIVDKYLGRYPVINIDFKDVAAESFEKFKEKLKLAIHYAFQMHTPVYIGLLNNSIQSYNKLKKESSYPVSNDLEYLLQVYRTIYPTDDVSKFQKHYHKLGQDASEVHIISSLFFLSEMLHNHYKTEVYIMLDEYDAPTNSFLLNLMPEKDEVQAMTLMRSLMGITFKGNTHLKKTLITGVSRIAKSSFLSGVNNLAEYSFLDGYFAQYYGFTEEEVQNLFNKSNISNEMQLEAKEWYNGYQTKSNLLLFNPWSIILFLNNGIIQNYWLESGNSEMISNLFQLILFRNKIENLMNNEDIAIDLNGLQFSIKDYNTLKYLIHMKDKVKIQPHAVDLFFSFLLSAGYLTISKVKKLESVESLVKIPNLEIKQEFTKQLKNYYKRVYSISPELFDNSAAIFQFFLNNPTQSTIKLKESLEELLAAHQPFININDPQRQGIHGNEDAVHSIFNTLVFHMKATSGSEVNVKHCGRADIILRDDKNGIGCIIELKYNDIKNTDLLANNNIKSAKAALIQAQNYLPYFKKFKNINTKICMGVDVTPEKKVTIETYIEPTETSSVKTPLG
jgi:hypothetical protein